MQLFFSPPFSSAYLFDLHNSKQPLLLRVDWHHPKNKLTYYILTKIFRLYRKYKNNHTMASAPTLSKTGCHFSGVSL